MKKIYNTVALNVQSIALEANILGASAIISGGQAQPTGGTVPGTNGGDANARSNAGGSTLGFDADLL